MNRHAETEQTDVNFSRCAMAANGSGCNATRSISLNERPGISANAPPVSRSTYLLLHNPLSICLSTETHMSRLDSRTSSPSDSIWLEPSEDSFRHHLVDLEKRTNAVPVKPQLFSLELDARGSPHVLPLHVEQQIANDFAFLAAVEEGAQSVAAACLEETTQPPGLTVRLAALDLSLSDEVKRTLQHIADILPSAACNIDGPTPIEAVFEQIVRLQFRRLFARLRSDKWEKPKYLSRQHKKPLWQDFANLIHRVQFLYTKKEAGTRRSVEMKFQDLVASYQAFEASVLGSGIELSLLLALIKASYRLCKDEDVATFAQRLENSVSTTPTSKVASAIKCLRQIEKIAAHWRIAMSLIDTSRHYPSIFQGKIQVTFLMPYESVPTAIGYESWATNCHVHAEVQLAVYYDLLFQSTSNVECIQHGSTRPSFYYPRAIGTSKWLCYLCYLFLHSHGSFVPTNTHGRLYDQWTIPDLAQYGKQLRARYRRIVRSIDAEVVKETNTTGAGNIDAADLVRWRAEPMTSRQNLLGTQDII